MKTFGNRLRLLRTGQHLSQEALARDAQITVGHLSRLERGQHSPTLDTVYRLARALGVSPGTLTGKKSDKNGQDSHSYPEDVVEFPHVS